MGNTASSGDGNRSEKQPILAQQEKLREEKRHEIVKELLLTEEHYVTDLSLLNTVINPRIIAQLIQHTDIHRPDKTEELSHFCTNQDHFLQQRG